MRWTVPTLLAAWLLTAAAQTPEMPPPASAFFKLPQVEQMQLSPGGGRLAFTSRQRGGRAVLYVMDLQAGGKTTEVARFASNDVHEPAWVNDERLVFTLTDLLDTSGEDQKRAPGLFSAKADGSHVRELVERHGRGFLSQGREESLAWNHLLLHVPLPAEGQVSEQVVVGRLVFGARGELDLVEPLWLNIRTGSTRDFDFVAPLGARRWWFDSGGRPRAVLVRREGRQSILWAEPKGRWRVLAEAALFELPFMPVHVGDDGTLFVSQTGASGQAVLARFDFERNAPEPKPVIAAPGFDFRGVAVMESRGTALQGMRVLTDSWSTVWFDAAAKAMQERVDAALPGRVNLLTCRRCEQDDGLALVHSWSDRHPGEVLLYRKAEKKWLRLSTQRPGIDPKRMASVELKRVHARDGRELPIWLTLPAGHEAGQKLPTVVLVHGGPWLRGHEWEWEALPQFLASRGYLVIAPEFRGSTGFGEEHFRAGWKQFGQRMQDDVADALRWAQRQGLAGERACIAGASYGGYSALMGLARDVELYRCGAAWAAVSDLMLYVKGQWWISDDLSELARRYDLPRMVGDPELAQERAMLEAHSPLRLAGQIKAPVLLAHGSEDLRVPYAHGRRMRDALEAAGRKPEWISYSGEAHEFRLEANQIDFAERLERFLAKHLKD